MRSDRARPRPPRAPLGVLVDRDRPARGGAGAATTDRDTLRRPLQRPDHPERAGRPAARDRDPGAYARSRPGAERDRADARSRPGTARDRDPGAYARSRPGAERDRADARSRPGRERDRGGYTRDGAGYARSRPAYERDRRGYARSGAGRGGAYRRGYERDHGRAYARRYGRGQRPGYWYGWDHRRGYGYHHVGRRRLHWSGLHSHILFPGYTHRHVYGSSFFAPGFSFAVGHGYGPTFATSWLPSYGYAHYDPFAWGYADAYAWNPTDLHTGFLRLKVRPRYAQVYVDGYFVGVVNEFDGIFQRLRLEEGPHRVEIVHPGFETLDIDVLIVPGEKVTFEGDLIPLP